MAKLHLTKETTVEALRNEFFGEFGAQLRIFKGNKRAESSDTLGDLGLTTEGELECRSSLTVGSFIERMAKNFGLKVKVSNCNDWVSVSDGLTLEAAGKLPKYINTGDMKSMKAYQRADKKKEKTNENESKCSTEEPCGEKKEFRVEIELSQAFVLHFLENNDNGIFEWSDWESYYEENCENQEYLPDIIPIMDNSGEIRVYDENDEVVFESDDLESIIQNQYLCIPSDPEDFEDYDNDDNPLIKSIKNPQKVCDQLNEDIAAEKDRLKEGVSYYCWAERCNMYKNSFTVEDSKFDITKLHFAQFADAQYEGIFDEVIDSEDVTAIGRILYNDELISEYDGADHWAGNSQLYTAEYEDGYVEVEEKELD